jgi:hypothetical protein
MLFCSLNVFIHHGHCFFVLSAGVISDFIVRLSFYSLFFLVSSGTGTGAHLIRHFVDAGITSFS